MILPDRTVYVGAVAGAVISLAMFTPIWAGHEPPVWVRDVAWLLALTTMLIVVASAIIRKVRDIARAISRQLLSIEEAMRIGIEIGETRTRKNQPSDPFDMGRPRS